MSEITTMRPLDLVAKESTGTVSRDVRPGVDYLGDRLLSMTLSVNGLICNNFDDNRAFIGQFDSNDNGHRSRERGYS
jgi:hypothetical protein